MFKSANCLFIHTLTSLHAGTGSSVSTIDLPIQREKFTNFPMIAGSGVKGSIRERFEFEANDKDITNVIFGPESDGSDYAGAVSFSDARLLLFPVKTLKGVFAWITCPMVIERFNRDMKIVKKGFEPIKVPNVFPGSACINKESDNVLDKKVVLEDYELMADDVSSDVVKAAAGFFAELVFKGQDYWEKKLTASLVIVPDDVFKDFVEYSTEIQTRIKIGDNGVVENGALFYEENLPAESLFYSLVLSSDPHKKHDELSNSEDIMYKLKELDKVHMQMGGDATIGKGLVSLNFFDGGK